MMDARAAFSWLGPRLALVALGATALLTYRAGGDLLQAVIRGVVAAIVVLWLQRIFLSWLQSGIEQHPDEAAHEPDEENTPAPRSVGR